MQLISIQLRFVPGDVYFDDWQARVIVAFQVGGISYWTFDTSGEVDYQ